MLAYCRQMEHFLEGPTHPEVLLDDHGIEAGLQRRF